MRTKVIIDKSVQRSKNIYSIQDSARRVFHSSYCYPHSGFFLCRCQSMVELFTADAMVKLAVEPNPHLSATGCCTARRRGCADFFLKLQWRFICISECPSNTEQFSILVDNIFLRLSLGRFCQPNP